MITIEDPASHIHLGTSGWSYPSGVGAWRPVFYPRRWKGDELAYYAERFRAVEVNTTFYRIPAPSVAREWARRTPPGFHFAVKLFRKFTHPEMYRRDTGASPEIDEGDIAGMRAVLDTLAEAGRLGPLLVQYPESTRCTDVNLSALVRTLDTFKTYQMAVELRHASWQQARTRDVLGHFGAAFVRIDDPVFRNHDEAFAPPAPIAYWRFHGRNAAMWHRPGAGVHRYEYYYSPVEVQELARAVQRHVEPGQQVHVYFNNHYAGMAIANAIRLARDLGLEVVYSKFANLAINFPDLLPLTGTNGGQLSILEEGL